SADPPCSRQTTEGDLFSLLFQTWFIPMFCRLCRGHLFAALGSAACRCRSSMRGRCPGISARLCPGGTALFGIPLDRPILCSLRSFLLQIMGNPGLNLGNAGSLLGANLGCLVHL